METGAALAAAAVIVLVLVLAAAYAWYNFFGWAPFAYQAGDTPAWQPAGQAGLDRLRFKGCTFTVARSDGVTRTLDATPVLNAMAAGFADGPANPPALSLERPLNAFSFVIAGFNDRATVANPGAPPWCAGPPPCQPAAGGPVCGPCPGTRVTLTGKVRTL